MVGLEHVDRTHAAVVGGKGAHLGELFDIPGIRVPTGFCVTTAAYRRMVAEVASIDPLVDRLAGLGSGDPDDLRRLSARIRRSIEEVAIPDEVERAIAAAVARLGDHLAYAVRSSATAEDLPTASFAGQYDTFLNVVGVATLLQQISRCWASLFSERAVAYRMRNGIDHRTVEMAVVVQPMVFPTASGVLFTADALTGNRRVASVEATFGLGEALVSGMVAADQYRVHNGKLLDTKVAAKQVVVRGSPDGGTRVEPLEPSLQTQPVLTEQQAVRLAGLGRRIESQFGCPQDIEWCLDEHGFQIVQSRPITTIFPVPEVDDEANHVYLSVGHGQMMTDPMTPLGLSVWQLTSPAPMRIAGSRLFVDITDHLSSASTRMATLETFGKSDPLIRDALETLLARDDFIPMGPDGSPDLPPPSRARTEPIEADPAIVTELIGRNRASVAELQREIETRSGSELLDFVLADIGELRSLLLDPQSRQSVMAGFEASWWLDDKLAEWLGEENAAAVLSLAAPNNVTAEMGLALLDVADVIRPHPEVVSFLRSVQDDEFLDQMAGLGGGKEAGEAIVSYLDRYGMRCVGEIDIARPRWAERPSALLPMLLSNLDNFATGERERRLERGRRQAEAKAQELMGRLRPLPDGAEKAEQVAGMIRRLRTFIGYREYPKYGMVSRYFIYKQALLAEADRLVGGNVLPVIDDIFFLTFNELHDVVRSRRADHALIARRRADFRAHGALQPPRVLTSDGETLHGTYQRDDLPAGALVGLAVSGGTIEGRARVVHDMAEADLEPGDILVTPHTDPSWSPLFVTIAGLVTEVGGPMTHGSVIAREFGLTAVVGVEGATRSIRDGQQIRLNGTRGYVEIMSGRDAPPETVS
ncbi:MAG TPA: rifamycin-inactivating phosphotransferase [Acidimicrobiia bacterium]|nr:rifamycin-inactivating phosphotransferase [Acidimicrobiia bacterium]